MPPTNANPLGNPSSNKDGVVSLRPPLYNPEDYCGALRALFNTSVQLPHSNPPPTTLILEHSTTHPPIIPGERIVELSKRTPEMGMKKFINGSELLFKLEADLRSAFPSFVQEFVSGENDGVTLVIDALRSLHQALDEVQGLREQRKLVLDERSCVQCIHLMVKSPDAVQRLMKCLYPVVHCIVSTNTSTRVLALEILTAVCESGLEHSYARVSEALLTLRLRLGEPIRCKVLVGAISSAAAGTFQATGIRFLRSFVASAPTPKYRVYLQVELIEAGLNLDVIRKSAELSGARESRLVLQELDEYENVCIDVDTIVRQNSQLRNSVATLQQEIATLKDKMKKTDPTAKPPRKKSSPSTPRNLSCVTPINHIVTPVDSEEEAEQINQILEDLHNIVNTQENLDNSSCSEIVPVLSSTSRPPPNYANAHRPVRSEPNLFESETTDETGDSHVRSVVQQLENSNVFSSTLPNFNTAGLASKFANFKSSKLDTPYEDSEKSRVKSLEHLDSNNFTLKWKYPSPNIPSTQPNSLVLQDYRMNRFGNVPKQVPTSSASGLFNKKKKKIHNHAPKTFQISLANDKLTNLSYNDLNERSGSSDMSERVTDLPSGMY